MTTGGWFMRADLKGRVDRQWYMCQDLEIYGLPGKRGKEIRVK